MSTRISAMRTSLSVIPWSVPGGDTQPPPPVEDEPDDALAEEPPVPVAVPPSLPGTPTVEPFGTDVAVSAVASPAATPPLDASTFVLDDEGGCGGETRSHDPSEPASTATPAAPARSATGARRAHRRNCWNGLIDPDSPSTRAQYI